MSNSSSISTILASHFGLEFSLQILYMELTVCTWVGYCRCEGMKIVYFFMYTRVGLTWAGINFAPGIYISYFNTLYAYLLHITVHKLLHEQIKIHWRKSIASKSAQKEEHFQAINWEYFV
jgi:hypothetical protein